MTARRPDRRPDADVAVPRSSLRARQANLRGGRIDRGAGCGGGGGGTSIGGGVGGVLSARPRPTLGQRLRDLLLVALLFCLAGCTITAYTAFRIWQVGQQDGRRNVDAIVVLGAAQYSY